MSAGQSPDGTLWFMAVWPLHDLFDKWTSTFRDALGQVLFVEVYTDNNVREYSGNCCVVDIFSYWKTYRWHKFDHTYYRIMISAKIEAEWGLMTDVPEREQEWLDYPMKEAVQPGSVQPPPIQLYRFTMDEEGIDTAGSPRGIIGRPQSWPRHAREIIRTIVTLFIKAGDPYYTKDPYRKTIGDVSTAFGDIVYMGDYDLLDVANYFMRRGDR
jgi:hypothetical protein